MDQHSDIAFTPSVKAVQARLGSRKGYASMEQRGGWNNVVTPDLAAFIAERDTLFLSTVNAEGQPSRVRVDTQGERRVRVFSKGGDAVPDPLA